MSIGDFISIPGWNAGVMPFGKLRLYRITRWAESSSAPSHVSRDEVSTLAAADVASSQFQGSDDHMIMLDLDVPAALIPSSTPGHSHLYIESRMSWKAYRKVLKALARAGVLEEGFVSASIERKATHLRLPWVRK